MYLGASSISPHFFTNYKTDNSPYYINYNYKYRFSAHNSPHSYKPYYPRRLDKCLHVATGDVPLQVAFPISGLTMIAIAFPE